MRGRDFLSLADFSKEEIQKVLSVAFHFKRRHLVGNKYDTILFGKTLAMIFEKPSTRTRVSFEVAMKQLGGFVLYLNWQTLQLSRGETIQDTGRVLSKYIDGIMARVYRHSSLIELAEAASVPVINGLSNLFHPCQAAGDLMTIYEKKNRITRLKIAFIGDGNNVCNSLMIGASKMGLNISVATPPGYEPRSEVVEMVDKFAVKSGSKVTLTDSPQEAVRNADVVYTDVWVSMGQEEEEEKRLRDFRGFQVNKELVKYAKKDFIFMHCLPAHRGLEVSPDVIDDPLHSIIWDQAENRLYIQKAILALII